MFENQNFRALQLRQCDRFPFGIKKLDLLNIRCQYLDHGAHLPDDQPFFGFIDEQRHYIEQFHRRRLHGAIVKSTHITVPLFGYEFACVCNLTASHRPYLRGFQRNYRRGFSI